MSWDPDQDEPGLLRATPSKALTIDEAIDRLQKGRFQRRLLYASGMCNGVNAMAVMALSFIRPAIVVEYDIDAEQSSWLASSVFWGILLGTLLFGPLGDSRGRRPLFLVSSSITALCSLASGFSTSFPMLVLLRFGVGIGVGGTVIPFDTLAELTPSRIRGAYLLYLGYFWTVGTSATPAIAVYAMREKESWKLFLILCSLPSFVSTVFGFLWVCESPRWLVTVGRRTEALDTLRQAVRTNGQDPDHFYPPGTVIVQSEEEEAESEIMHSLGSLFLPKWRFMVICMLLVWAALDFIYWGTVSIVTLVFAAFEGEDLSDYHEGEQFQYDYGAIISSSVAEFMGQTAVLLLIDRIGRVPSQALAYALGGISVFSLCMVSYLQDEGTIENETTVSGRWTLVLLAFASRMFIMAATSVTWVHTAEMLPQQIRNSAHAVADALAGSGGAGSAFLVSPNNSMLLIGICMGSVTIIVAALTWMLPETRGIALGTAISRGPSRGGSMSPSSRRSSRSGDSSDGKLMDITEATADPSKEFQP